MHNNYLGTATHMSLAQDTLLRTLGLAMCYMLLDLDGVVSLQQEFIPP